jgi:hypothetical protein
MEMDWYKSRISDGVLVQKQNRTSQCLKLHASVSQFFGTKCTHSRVPGLKGEALFSKLGGVYHLVWATELSLAAIGRVFPALVLGYKSFNRSMYQVPIPTLIG